MRRILVVLGTMILVLSGCGGSALEDYQSALMLTESYTNGQADMALSIDLVFDETGLSFEDQRKLSYFERIDMVTSMTYLEDGNVFNGTMDGYFNFGGLGFDMVYYIKGDQVLVKLPIMDKYMRLSDQGTEIEAATSQETGQEEVFSRLVEAWNGLLKEEDVFSGSKAYVMTDKGQLKTTTYTIAINDEQFEALKGLALTMLDDQALVAAFLQNGQNFTGETMDEADISDMLGELLEAVSLESFEGKAYVDFDGRLVRQEFYVDLINPSAKPGQVASLHLSYESNYDLLGQVEAVAFPEVKEEDYLKIEAGDSIQDYFPEGLF